ncbi:MAG: glutamyl-tRNA reductase [Saprospiraceae bacterium]|nr:glutamyl-tRNA reductase [Saprospiraceae bacterium]
MTVPENPNVTFVTLFAQEPVSSIMLDGYHILTLTHRDATLDTLAHAIAPSENTDFALQSLKAGMGWEELFYLATCNRVTYVFYTQNTVNQNIAAQMLSALRPDLSELVAQKTSAQMRLLQGAAAVTHLLEVAASMDSLVVGEREIIRQLRLAYDQSREWNLTGDHLRLLMGFTIETAKEIYTHTGIGRRALSVVALAFGEMLKTGLRPEARILMIGAGETNALFAKFLVKSKFTRVTVFNRTFEKARSLAQANGWRAFSLDELAFYSEGFDALIVCTGATQAIIDPALYRELLANESGKKIVVDLSIPHNVDRETVTGFPMQYIEIESLKETANENLAYREQERDHAAGLIQARILQFRERWHERQAERSMAHIPAEVKAVKDRAINEVFGKEFAQLDPSAQDLVQRMLGYMEKKCVAIPIKAAKAIRLHGKKRREATNQQ